MYSSNYAVVMIMAKNAVYSTTNTQVLINPNKDGGDFLDELFKLIPDGKDVLDVRAPKAVLYTPDDSSQCLKYKRPASKIPTDTMYHLIGGDVLVICAKKSDIDNPLKLLAEDLDLYDDQNHASTKYEGGLVLPEDLEPICKIWYNGDSGVPHVDFIEKHDILINPTKLYDLAMKYSVNGNNKYEAVGAISSEKPLDIFPVTRSEILIQPALS